MNVRCSENEDYDIAALVQVWMTAFVQSSIVMLLPANQESWDGAVLRYNSNGGTHSQNEIKSISTDYKLVSVVITFKDLKYTREHSNLSHFLSPVFFMFFFYRELLVHLLESYSRLWATPMTAMPW